MHRRDMCTLSMCLGVSRASHVQEELSHSKSFQVYESAQRSQAGPKYVTQIQVLEKFIREKGYLGHGISLTFLLPVF